MRFLFILILIISIGSLRLIRVFERTQHESHLFTSSPCVYHLSFFDNLIQQNYLFSDEPNIEDFKNLLTLFLTVGAGFLTTTLNLRRGWEISLGMRKSYPSSFFASLPLRSPPVLS